MASSSSPNSYILGLDVGDKRIGAAIASTIARLPRPLDHLINTSEVMPQIAELVRHEGVNKVVIGLPRSLDGQETAQSQKVRQFASELAPHIDCELEFADETLSTVRAEEYLKASKSPGVSADSLAACYILEEFLAIMERSDESRYNPKNES